MCSLLGWHIVVERVGHISHFCQNVPLEHHFSPIWAQKQIFLWNHFLTFSKSIKQATNQALRSWKRTGRSWVIVPPVILDPSLSPPGAKNQVFGGFLGFWTLVSHGNTFVHSLWCKGEVMATSSGAWGPSEVPIPFQHNQATGKASCCNKETTRLCAPSLQT